MGSPKTVVIRADGTMRWEGEGGPEVLSRRPGRYLVHECASGVVTFERLEEGQRPSGDRLVGYGEVTNAMTVLEVLQSLTVSAWRGNLTVVAEGIRRRLRISGGILTSAESNVPSERLGELMIARGKITKDQLRRCLVAHSGRRLGESVVLEGLMDPEELFAMLQAQARCIFQSALLTTGGYYTCSVPEDAAQAPAMAVHLPVQELLMESMQRIDELALFRQRIPNGHVCPQVTPAASRLTIDEGLSPVAALATGEVSILEIARQLGLDEFTATKKVMQLVQIGYVRILDPEMTGPVRIAHIVSQLNAILRRISATVSAAGAAEDMAWTFNEWVRDTTLSKYFGTLPQPDGSLSAEMVQQALDQLDVADPCAALQSAAIELISFAMFAASPGLTPEAERALTPWVNEQILELKR